MQRHVTGGALALTLLPLVAAGACRSTQPGVEAAAERTPVTVSVAMVEGRTEPTTIQATGSFRADEESDVAPEASGRVVATPVDVGDFVNAGQVLVRIQGVDASLRLDEARAAEARAEAAVKLAESERGLAQVTLQRQLQLLKSGHIARTAADEARTRAETTEQTVVTARASLAEARAQRAQAEKAVKDVTVKAPFSGYITARNVSAGEYVQPSTPVVTLVKLNPIRLQLTIPGVQAAQISRGQRVSVSVDAYPGRDFTGTLTAINPVIRAESRSFVAEARIPNPDAALKPGMFGEASIDQGRARRSLLVPREALVQDVNTDSWHVFVVDRENRAHLKVVQLDAQLDMSSEGGEARILTGVSEGDRVATNHLADLYDTAPVTIAPAGTADR